MYERLLSLTNIKIMARATLAPLFQHFRGKLGNLVFRKYGKTTVVYEYPEPSRKHESTARQKLNQGKFKEAIGYARQAMRDPILKMAYRLKAQELNSGNAYNAAMRDFLNKPLINGIEVQGKKLFVDATDDFRVDRVVVQLMNASGVVVEEGEAEFCQIDDVWAYEIKGDSKGCLNAFVEVYDVPGNRVGSVVDL